MQAEHFPQNLVQNTLSAIFKASVKCTAQFSQWKIQKTLKNSEKTYKSLV